MLDSCLPSQVALPQRLPPPTHAIPTEPSALSPLRSPTAEIFFAAGGCACVRGDQRSGEAKAGDQLPSGLRPERQVGRGQPLEAPEKLLRLPAARPTDDAGEEQRWGEKSFDADWRNAQAMK